MTKHDPIHTRAVAVAPNIWDSTTFTVEVIAATENPV